ncbi:MAG: NAD(P)/FAD-dependent oxidoreductase [bacterium]|nr:NAD(P)/FAD-dependent oxidoreductase [bacterium]
MKKKIVILGGGFGGTSVYRHLHRTFHRDPRVEISMVSETNYFLFTPLLHEVATGSLNPENIIEPLRSVIGCCLTNFHEAKVESINTKKKFVTTHEQKIPYDILVLALGSKTNFYSIPGAEKNAFTLKSLDDAIALKNRFIEICEEASEEKDIEKRKEMLHFVVVGGGPTGVELIAEMQEFLVDTLRRQYDPKQIARYIQCTLVQNEAEILTQFNPRVRTKSLRTLQKKRITVLFNTSITSITPTRVHMKNGKPLHARTVIWTAGIKPRTVLFDTKVPQLPNEKLIVSASLQLKENPSIFVLGDMMTIETPNACPPATAQAATKEAKTVAKNITRIIKGLNVKSFRYHESGKLLSLGQWHAVAEFKYVVFSGAFAWWLWRTIYLSKIISIRKRIKVALDWTFNLFSPRDISRF